MYVRGVAQFLPLFQDYFAVGQRETSTDEVHQRLLATMVRAFLPTSERVDHIFRLLLIDNKLSVEYLGGAILL